MSHLIIITISICGSRDASSTSLAFAALSLHRQATAATKQSRRARLLQSRRDVCERGAHQYRLEGKKDGQNTEAQHADPLRQEQMEHIATESMTA